MKVGYRLSLGAELQSELTAIAVAQGTTVEEVIRDAMKLGVLAAAARRRRETLILHPNGTVSTDANHD